MDLFQRHWQFIASLVSIIVVDLTLSGDNAVVIAAAAKSLAPDLRKRALIAGAACAVIALVTATFFATRLLNVRFLQMIGGIAVLWIAINLFREEPPLESSAAHLAGFWKAMWFIIVADVTMSTDNILAVAALAHGSFALLLFGLSISIPLVVFASGVLAALMDRYPVIVYIGAGLLGRVAGEMIATDAFILQRFAPDEAWRYTAEALGAASVLIAGWLLKRRGKDSEAQR
ncbi:MAG TPA: TerC family protein [Bryobacteraceae bacterium]|nr:TerC family protein [Bryobacteraceae bacterium]